MEPCRASRPFRHWKGWRLKSSKLVNESKKPVHLSIAHAAREINDAITEAQAAAIAAAVVEESRKLCFPNWHLKSDVKSDLFLAITRLLVQQFKNATFMRHPQAL